MTDKIGSRSSNAAIESGLPQTVLRGLGEWGRDDSEFWFDIYDRIHLFGRSPFGDLPEKLELEMSRLASD